MDIVYGLMVGLHLVGMAALLVGYYLSWQASRGNRPLFPHQMMVWGARAQLITGLIVVALGETVADQEYNHVKIAVKLLIALAVAGMVESGAAKARRHEFVQPRLVHIAGVLAIVNALVATLW